MKNQTLFQTLFFCIFMVLSAASFPFENWFEENALQLQNFQNDLSIIPLNIPHSAQSVMAFTLCFSDATNNLVSASKASTIQKVDNVDWAEGQRRITNLQSSYGLSDVKSDGIGWSFFNSPSIDLFSVQSKNSKALPFILFGIGFISVLKMKWIRLKKNIELS